MPWIYILHLDQPYHHARHYSGCARDLTDRLIYHATGQGANFTRVLYLQGLTWTLGNIFQVNEDLHTIRQVERILKNQHHAPRYCTLCTAHPKRLPATETIPLKYSPVLTTADAIRVHAERQRPWHSSRPGNCHQATNDRR